MSGGKWYLVPIRLTFKDRRKHFDLCKRIFAMSPEQANDIAREVCFEGIGNVINEVEIFDCKEDDELGGEKDARGVVK